MARVHFRFTRNQLKVQITFYYSIVDQANSGMESFRIAHEKHQTYNTITKQCTTRNAQQHNLNDLCLVIVLIHVLHPIHSSGCTRSRDNVFPISQSNVQYSPFLHPPEKSKSVVAQFVGRTRFCGVLYSRVQYSLLILFPNMQYVCYALSSHVLDASDARARSSSI